MSKDLKWVLPPEGTEYWRADLEDEEDVELASCGQGDLCESNNNDGCTIVRLTRANSTVSVLGFLDSDNQWIQFNGQATFY